MRISEGIEEEPIQKLKEYFMSLPDMESKQQFWSEMALRKINKRKSEYMKLERSRYKKMLEGYLSDIEVPFSPYLHIVNLGCGKCDEASVVCEYFSRYCSKVENIQFIGIDIDKDQISRAIKNNNSEFEIKIYNNFVGPKYQFIEGDARELNKIVNKPIDITIVRHPWIFNTSQNWASIFKQAFTLSRQNGLLITSCYDDEEHIELINTVSKAGYSILRNTVNEFTRFPLGHSEDYKLIVAKS